MNTRYQIITVSNHNTVLPFGYLYFNKASWKVSYNIGVNKTEQLGRSVEHHGHHGQIVLFNKLK